MKVLRKTVQLILVFLLMAGGFSCNLKTVQGEDGYDFDGNYEHYYTLCTNTSNTLSDSDKQACKAFREYTTQKQKQTESYAQQLQKELTTIKANITQQGKKIADLQKEIDQLEQQIKVINANIAEIEGEISKLETQIAEREQKIQKIDEGIRTRMEATQSNVILNSYIKFIMGADSFIDILRRISAVNEITAYDQEMIRTMEAEKKLLESDKAALQSKKDDLIAHQSELENQKNLNNKLKAMAQELIAQFELQEEEFERQYDNLKEDLSFLDETIANIDMVIDELYPSEKFFTPMKKVWFYISSACYYYEGTYGGFHAAVDIAIGRGTAMYPVANGVVIDAKDGCPVNGYYGSTCNSSRGNYVFILVRVQDKYYAVYYYHLSTVNVKPGDKVYEGRTLLGTSGNSGSSTGPHLHFSIYYVGDYPQDTYSSLLRQYQQKGFRWGLSYAISSACYKRNWRKPCFEDPEEIYHWYYNGGYYYAGG